MSLQLSTPFQGSRTFQEHNQHKEKLATKIHAACTERKGYKTPQLDLLTVLQGEYQQLAMLLPTCTNRAQHYPALQLGEAMLYSSSRRSENAYPLGPYLGQLFDVCNSFCTTKHILHQARQHAG
ncbi:hypothetical protein AAC387_Pa07g3745 [Persea americana]